MQDGQSITLRQWGVLVQGEPSRGLPKGHKQLASMEYEPPDVVWSGSAAGAIQQCDIKGPPYYNDRISDALPRMETPAYQADE